MKWIIIIFTLIVAYAIFTGNMGGAKNATANYYDTFLKGRESK